MTCWLCGFETTELATNAKAPTCENGPCQICIAVADVDEEINQAEATLRRLLSKRCDLRSEQNRVHGTLIHRLPTELKNHIFELLIPTRTEWGEILLSWNKWGRMRTRIEGPKTPLYTSVCRNWRDVAWSNPVLWSTIHISLGNPSSPSNFVHNWILRSRTLPLTLHIAAREQGSSGEELKGIIDAISQCSNRWHSLSLDIPLELLCTFHHNNFQCHLLKNLRINVRDGRQYGINQPMPLSNPTMSPQKIEIYGVPFRLLQISWNHLTSAKFESLDVEDLVQLFQHASQMTCCYVSEADYDERSQIPSIIHRRLKTLSFYYGRASETFLQFLTLPCLQEFRANEMFLLEHLPALAHRSSCPLTRITFNLIKSSRGGDWGLFHHLRPLPGVTDLVFENVEELEQTVTIKKLLLEEYFPDLRRLILGLDAFEFLWDEAVISQLLDRKRPRLDAAIKGRHRKILVVEPSRNRVFNVMKWNPSIGEKLKALQLDITFRTDGFEILIPED